KNCRCERGDVDVRLASAIAIDEAALELIGHLLAHFEAADANRWAEKRGRYAGIERRRVERFRSDVLYRAAPAGVNVRDRAARVDDRDRQAVGDFNRQRCL